jgi:hypothetical protein
MRLTALGAVAVTALISATTAGCDSSTPEQKGAPDYPEIDGVREASRAEFRFCPGDTCSAWEEITGILTTFEVEATGLTEQAIVDEYRSELNGWDDQVVSECRSAAKDVCDEHLFATFADGDSVVTLDFLNWDGGKFEVWYSPRG